MVNIFSLEQRVGDSIANIGWQAHIEKELNTQGLIPFAYIASYKDSADYLVQMVLATPLRDMYVFPIVFLYRQYMELLLKNAYFKMSLDTDQQKIAFIKKSGHKLSPVWYKIKPILKSINFPKPNIKHVETAVKDFEKYDSHSFNFRFFSNKDFTPTLPENLSVDLKALKDVIDKVDSILYGTYGT